MMRAGYKFASLCVVVGLCASARRGDAQEKPEYLLTAKQTKQAGQDKECPCLDGNEKTAKSANPPKPWQFKARIGSMFQLNSNKGVVGKRDGTSRSIGADLHFEANWKQRAHEVRNRLDANVVFVKTPNTSGWVSATDVFEMESIYQYRIRPLFGVFSRAGLATSMFVGRDLRTNSVQYRRPDGTLTSARTALRITDPFQPVTLLQSVGFFVNPVRKQTFDLDFRIGVGAREVFADGQLGIKDDKDTTGIVEVVELRDYNQAGLELISMVRGQLYEKRVSYYFGGEFLLPVIRSSQESGDNRGAFKLIDKKLRFGLAYKIASWATILYEIRLVHQPQLISDYQIQNHVGFKASYSLL